MTANGWFQIALFFIILLVITKPIGAYMARVFAREKTFLDPVLRPAERLLYRCTRVDESHEGASHGRLPHAYVLRHGLLRMTNFLISILYDGRGGGIRSLVPEWPLCHFLCWI